AGGLGGNFTGESDFLEQGECMSGNPRIYAQMVSVLRKYSKFATADEKSSRPTLTSERSTGME
ncbi:MAG: inositol monophosphatase, partial [Limnohabitans sp.]|nr:inositol monophosphatase [Limnohabitans sp.]